MKTVIPHRIIEIETAPFVFEVRTAHFDALLATIYEEFAGWRAEHRSGEIARYLTLHDALVATTIKGAG